VNRRGVTLIEMLVGASILVTMLFVLYGGLHTMERQAHCSSNSLAQVQEGLLLMEAIRIELASLVLNPFSNAADHEGNSFVISKPNGTSIQFVMERLRDGERQRFLVCYESVTPPKGTPGLLLHKRVYVFRQNTPWQDPVDLTTGWRQDWIGPLVEDESSRFRNLAIQDLRWRCLVPQENEGKVYFRVKLVLRTLDPGRMLPFSTLVSVATPDLPTRVSDCPCLFAPCFDPTRPDCHCCSARGES